MTTAAAEEEKHYWDAAHSPYSPVDIVVVPSLLLDSEEEFTRIPGLVHKEEVCCVKLFDIYW